MGRPKGTVDFLKSLLQRENGAEKTSDARCHNRTLEQALLSLCRHLLTRFVHQDHRVLMWRGGLEIALCNQDL